MTNISSKYDEFQKDAVDAICRDFVEKSNGKYLLVIPTGGGKTYTAVKSVCELYKRGVLEKGVDKTVWFAHRAELIKQAQDTFESYTQNNSQLTDIKNVVDVQMISAAPKKMSDKSIKLVIIDEAHHGAAKSYQSIFDNISVGVLGLTATPSRHDGKPLEFDRESFSIGFPDLVKKGIILKPEITRVTGGYYNLNNIVDDGELELLNENNRNRKICDHIVSKSFDYEKIVIFVGTKKHARDLFAMLSTSDAMRLYESISYIVGSENSKNIDRDEFIKLEKSYRRSIVVNVQVLSEGYDDKKINTVIMAAPSRSKLYYMQSIGRAIRVDPANIDKKAHIVEVIDELPNIRYRIDNRWLFSELNDVLEPSVIDVSYSSKDEFNAKLTELGIQYGFNAKNQARDEVDVQSRYSLLLFKKYVVGGSYASLPLLIDNNNRSSVCNIFNFLSERMSKYCNKYNYRQVFAILARDVQKIGLNDSDMRTIYDAMENAYQSCYAKEKSEAFITSGYPWITYAAFNYRQADELTDELMSFLDGMVNKEDIVDLIKSKNYEVNDHLIKIPLPFRNSIGKVLSSSDFEKFEALITSLRIINESECDAEQCDEVYDVFTNSTLPIEPKYMHGLVQIVKDETSYNILLT